MTGKHSGRFGFGGKKRGIGLASICVIYVAAALLIVCGRRGGFGKPDKEWVILIALTIAASVLLFFVASAFERKEAEDEQLYGLLSLFEDTVLFEYVCRDGSLRLTSNAGAQIDQALLRKLLAQYALTAPPGGEIGVFEFSMKADCDSYHWCVCHYRAVYDKEGGGPASLIGKLDDISRQKEREERLLVQSTRDGLTGVYNKTAIEYMVEEILQKESQGALLMIDVDNFKEINDQFGHLAGDGVLVKIGALLRELFPDTDLIGRVGGDEFVIYSESSQNEERARHLLHSAAGYVPDIGCHISISIGIAERKNGEEYQELFIRADQAMYRAKQAGKNRIAGI